MNVIDKLYGLGLVVASGCVLNTRDSEYTHTVWFYKSMLVYIATALVLYSRFRDNRVVNTYLFPMVVILNFMILPWATFTYTDTKRSNTWLQLLLFVGILYLLATYKFERFQIDGGMLKAPDTQWLWLSALVLTGWYLVRDPNIIRPSIVPFLVVLVWYPLLLFDPKEYFYHRAVSLTIFIALQQYPTN